ncbi:MAG: methionyl-tRNA formyltransferase [Dehalococcoidia bacterium]|nr:methionyl-tRNA formyltransferase [Dehalococcoidia bacterium]
MRIVFMGAAEFSVPALERLIFGEHQLVAVYTQPDKPAGRGRALAFSPVKGVAQEHGLEVRQPKSFDQPTDLEFLTELRPDVIVVAAFGKILPQEVLTIPLFGCINLHPSLLPRHRGPSPIPGAILAGDEWSGVSIMLMEEGVDCGPILSRRRVAIEPQDTTGSLTAKLAQIAAELLEETLPLWLSRSLTPQPQGEGATYTRLLSKGEGEIDWHLPAPQIWRRVRAFNPWPSSYTRWQGKAFKIHEAALLPVRLAEGGEPGRVIKLAGGEVGVQTGEGVLRLLRVQLEGRRAVSAAEFVRGQRGFIGALLPSLK